MFRKNTMGFIKLQRNIQEWEWYGEPTMVAFWIHLLINANWEDKDWHGEKILRGQLVTSLAHLSVETGLSLKQVRVALQRLKKGKQIVTIGASKWTKITICDYDSYFTCDDYEGQTKGTIEGKQVASEGQAEGILGATTKEDKNIRKQEEEKKVSKDTKEKKFVKPTVDEVKAYCQERGYNIDAEYFIDYYESKGWVVGKSPMKDWKASVRTWWIKNRANAPQAPAPAPTPQPQYGLFNLSDLRKPQSIEYGE